MNNELLTATDGHHRRSCLLLSVLVLGAMVFGMTTSAHGGNRAGVSFSLDIASQEDKKPAYLYSAERRRLAKLHVLEGEVETKPKKLKVKNEMVNNLRGEAALEEQRLAVVTQRANKATLEKQVQNWTQTVGEPRSHWIGDTWIPAQGSRVYSPREIGTLFSRKCTLFVGDSLQRRAADTLHFLLQDATQNDHYHDVREDVFPHEYFGTKKHDRGYTEHFIEDPTNSTTHGCLTTDWRPRLNDVNVFAKEFTNSTKLSKHDVVVVGSTVWDVDTKRKPNAIRIRQHINKTIHILHENVPDSVLIVWKSSGWCASCGWAGDEKVRGKANNYRIYAANDEAQKVIEHLGAPNLVYLDWGREILPRSIGNLRLASNDGNKFHYGLEARLQFLQMLTELYDDPTSK